MSAYLEYPNQATGTFVSSTGEAPGANRFEVVGTRGQVLLEHDKLLFTRNEVDMLQFSKTTNLGFAKPDVWRVEIPFDNAANPHAMLMQNFVNAILEGEPLIAPGAEARHSTRGSYEIPPVCSRGFAVHPGIGRGVAPDVPAVLRLPTEPDMTDISTLERTIIARLQISVHDAVAQAFRDLAKQLDTLECGPNPEHKYKMWTSANVQYHSDKTNHGAAVILDDVAKGVTAAIVKSRTPAAIAEFINRVETLANP